MQPRIFGLSFYIVKKYNKFSCISIFNVMYSIQQKTKPILTAILSKAHTYIVL